jgi:hypothetical protein
MLFFFFSFGLVITYHYINIGTRLILKNISQIKKIKILSLLKKHSWEGLIVLDLTQLECLASLLLCQVKEHLHAIKRVMGYLLGNKNYD